MDLVDDLGVKTGRRLSWLERGGRVDGAKGGQEREERSLTQLSADESGPGMMCLHGLNLIEEFALPGRLAGRAA